MTKKATKKATDKAPDLQTGPGASTESTTKNPGDAI